MKQMKQKYTKQKIILIVSIIVLGFFYTFNTRAQDVNLDTLVEQDNFTSNATKLVITSDKNLNKINMLNMPNLVQVNISDVNIPNSSLIHFKNKIKLLYLKNVVINIDGIYDDNIEKIEIRHSYIYGNSTKSKTYQNQAIFSANHLEDSTYNNQINTIAKSIYKNGMSKEDIIKEVTLYVTNHITYNLAMADNGKSYAANSLSGQGVCSEYAYLEAQLLNKLGIYTLTVYGYPVDRSEYHAWNVVYLNNNWYTLDPTWLDTKGSSNTYDASSERYQKYYLRPLSANIYKSDFTLYNSIPASERIATPIVNITNTQSTTNYNNTTNNQTNNNTSSTTQTTNPSNTTNNTNQNTNINETKTTEEEITNKKQEENNNTEDNKQEDDETININQNEIIIPNEVEVPDTESNNIIFIIIGLITVLLGINFIKTQKD